MARFKYLGEPSRPNMVSSYGPALKIRYKNKDGTVTEVEAANQETGFVVNEDIGEEITDDRALRHLRNDSRFEEIV